MLGEPRFDYGQEVRVIRSIRNDGSFFGKRSGELLVQSGRTGFVRNVGTFLQDQVIYEVHFLDQDITVGVRETELQTMQEPWVDCQFQNRDHVICKVPLAVNGEVVFPSGSRGLVVKTLAGEGSPVLYHVSFGERILQIPEGVLSLDEEACAKSASGCSSCALSEQC